MLPLLGTATTFLPSPMVARNFFGSKSRLLFGNMASAAKAVLPSEEGTPSRDYAGTTSTEDVQSCSQSEKERWRTQKSISHAANTLSMSNIEHSSEQECGIMRE